MAYISEGAHTYIHMYVRTVEGNVAPERTKERREHNVIANVRWRVPSLSTSPLNGPL